MARSETSGWEWAAAALSALLVGGSIGYMAYEGWTEPDSPPRIEISLDTVVEGPGGFLVEFEARNSGRTTAADLRVEGELRDGERVLERAGAVIDFVPADSRRRAGLLFSLDPRRHTLVVRPVGYDLP